MTHAPVCLVVTPDLLGASQLQEAARRAGLAPVRMRGPDIPPGTPEAVAVVIDLSRAGVAAVTAAVATRPRPLVIAIGPHVDTPLLEAARAAGADHVLPHSAVTGRLVALLQEAANRRAAGSTSGHP